MVEYTFESKCWKCFKKFRYTVTKKQGRPRKFCDACRVVKTQKKLVVERKLV